MTRRRQVSLFLELLAWILGLVIAIPLLLVLLNSIKDRAGASLMSLSLPNPFHFGNYMTVIKEGNLLRSFLNSLVITSGSVVLSILASSMASFVLSRNRTKIRNGIYYYFLIGLIAPLNMITVIRTLQFIHLMSTYPGIILLYSALLMSFSIFLYYGFVNTVPRELDESALIDGSTSLDLFLKIVFPLLKPVTITIMIINFMGAWNNFIIPLYVLNRSDMWPMTLAIYNFYGRRMAEWQLVNADVVLTVAPVVLLYILGQRYIISGMTAGAIKG